MDSSVSRSVVLLSIRPEYVERILDGSKRVELRKTKISPDVRYVVVYSTSPVKRVVAFFKVAAIVQDAPRAIWARYGNVSGVSYAFFQQYYANARHAIAIEVEEVFPLQSPVQLCELDDALSPPQCLQYVPESYVKKLVRRVAMPNKVAAAEKLFR
jgi:predicted transcriptional regulator